MERSSKTQTDLTRALKERNDLQQLNYRLETRLHKFMKGQEVNMSLEQRMEYEVREMYMLTRLST